MGKYSQLETDIYSIFSNPDWAALEIPAFPSNYVANGTNINKEYVRIAILTNERPLNRKSVAGIVQIEIFIPVNKGPSRIYEIADELDELLVDTSIKLNNSTTQFGISTVGNLAIDRDNASLFRGIYTIPVKHFGVL